MPARPKGKGKSAPTQIETEVPLAVTFERYAGWLALVLVLVATIRIVATYSMLNHTHDEPAHVAAGMEWLEKRAYQFEHQHPPLTRVVAALLPRLDGGHLWGREGMWNEGVAILYRSGGYERTLTLARAGNLVFFWVGCAVVYVWARRYFGPLPGACALLLFTLIPAVLGHAGLATTDMGLAAMVGAALLMTLVLLEKPTVWMGVLWGTCIGLGVVSKFSFLPFYPSCLAAGVVFHFWRTRKEGLGPPGKLVVPVLAGLGVAFLLIWAMYRFSYGPTPYGFPLPFPELFSGIEQVRNHNRAGHPAYLLGQNSSDGFWYYYPVALMVKTPLAFLGLAGMGLVAAWRSGRFHSLMPLAFSCGLLAFAVTSQINIGIRHVLPLYLMLAVLAGWGLARALKEESLWVKRLAMGLLLWLGIASVWIHPDYIAYFNELTGDAPEEVLVDSDLDWGQDVKRAGKYLKSAGAQWVAYQPFVLAYDEEVHGFPPIVAFDPVNPTPGWNLVSTTVWKALRFGQKPATPLFADRLKPRQRVGRGMLLFYIPIPPGTRPQFEVR
ncbi:MAG: glycosyltransferase family 39 protein [Bryobacterales bacterium]|nr:glycosyltransferase family 39 protein [Bryobacterales bacterium]